MIRKSMTGGSPWKHILSFSFPILAGALLQQLYNTADTIIVGNFVGENALAAVGTTNTLAFLFLSAAIGFSAGNGVLVSQHFGAWNEKMVRKNASTGILLLLGLGLLLSVTAILLTRWAYTHFVAVPPEILEDTILYFQIYSAGLFFQFGYNILSAVLRAIGDSAATLYFLLIASVINVGLDLLFIAVFHWGVAGAAAATGIAQALSMSAAYYYMVRKYPVFRYRLKEFTWDNRIALDTLIMGFPITVQLMIVSLGLTMVQRVVNSFGKVMTASFAVGQRIEMYLHLPCNALQATLATYTGQNIGACRMDRVKKGAGQGVLISLLLTAFISFFVWFYAGEIIRMFGLSDQSASLCIRHLKAVALTNVILSSYVPLIGVFQGAKHPVFAVFIALGALAVRVIVTYWFKDGAFFGSSIVWWNSLFGFCTGCLITWLFYLSGMWQKNCSVTGK